MPLLIAILISSAILASLVLARVYEIRSGKNIWKFFGLTRVLDFLEMYFSKGFNSLSRFDSKNIALYLKNTWHVLKVFYLALQRLATEKVAGDRRAVSQNGNRAASFYLKEIKEHKEKMYDEQGEKQDNTS